MYVAYIPLIARFKVLKALINVRLKARWVRLYIVSWGANVRPTRINARSTGGTLM
jgi:hypothetical protein